MGESEEHAAMAARHLSEAKDRIEPQHELVGHLRNLGLDTEFAEVLLKSFKDIMISMLDHDAIARRGARGS